MSDRTISLRPTWALAVLAIMTLAACESATDGVQINAVHPANPDGNALVNSQRVYVTPAGISRAVEDGQGGFFFAGTDATVGRLDGAEDVAWSDDTLHRVGDVRRVEAFGPWVNGVIAVGSLDRDDDGTSDAGGVAFYNNAGVLIDTLCVFSDTFSVHLTGVVATGAGDPALFVVVGEVTEGAKKPFAAQISFASVDSSFAVVADSTYDTMPAMSFIDVDAQPVPAPGVYVARNTFLGSTSTFADVLLLDDTFDVLWTTPVVADSTVTEPQNYKLREIQYVTGLLFTCGDVQINKGGYIARAGIVASIASNGDSLWTQTLNYSGWQESFDGLHADGTTVYAVGRGFQVYLPDFGTNLGYGLVARYDAVTGARQSAATIGSTTQWSGFSSFFVQGGNAVGLGFRENPNTKLREGWLVDMMTP